MRLTKATSRLTSFTDPEKSYEEVFLVDTGATDCMARANELDKLGIERTTCE